MESNGKIMTAIITLAIGLAVGGGVGYAISNNNEMSNTSTMTASVSEGQPSTATKAADLRVAMNNLLGDHVTTNIATNQAIAMGAPASEIAGAKAAETANAVALADAIGGIFGEDAKKTITPMFVDHIEESNAIAEAIAAGDSSAKQKAQTELNEYLTDLSGFFSGAIKALPQDAVYGLLSEHENLVTQATEEFKAGNYEKSYSTEQAAHTQASKIADTLSAEIVKQMPEKF